MNTPDLATVAYALSLTSFTTATVVTLALHVIGRHSVCRRNMAVSAFLGLLTMLSQNLKPYMSPAPAVQFLEALTVFTIIFTPLILLLSKLVQLNNQEARVYDTSELERKLGEDFLSNIRDILDSSPATSQYSHEAVLSSTFSPQAMKPVQLSLDFKKPVPLQETIDSPRNVSEDRLCPIFPKDGSELGSPPRSARQPSKMQKQKKAGKKIEPKIDDIINSPEYTHLLTRLLIKMLREGVRYKGKQYKIYLDFIRPQDIYYVWHLGRKKKPPITKRAEHRLRSLQLVRVRKKVRLREGGAEIAEVLELTERGWAFRNAIIKALKKMLERMAGRIAVPAA